jgi:putative two-component system response regulator
MKTRDVRNGKPAGTVLVVDDLDTNLDLLERMLSAQGYNVRTAHDGQEALEAVAAAPPDVVLTDIRMPRRDGFGLCRELKAAPSTRLIPVVLMTGASEADDRIQAIEAGATDLLGKPIDLPELKARVRSLMQLKHFTDELDSAEVVLKTLALMIEARDAYTQGHCERLARYATRLGERLGLPQEDLVALTKGGYFHDIGKIAIPDSILLKPGKLTPEEFERMKQHTVIGERLCGDLRALHDVRPIVRHHHEHLDGSGYPDGLSGDDVPLLAQIIAIVDVFDAITTDRPYRLALSKQTAFTALRDEVARGWRDAELVETFITTQTERITEPEAETIKTA